jgi:hypothetical protein
MVIAFLIIVIPGRVEDASPESRAEQLPDSGFALTRADDVRLHIRK